MRQFCRLFGQLDRSEGTAERVALLAAHLEAAPAADAAWALHCLLGKQRRRLITARRLRQIGQRVSGLPDWLFEASHAQVGDSAETIALLVGRTRGEPGDGKDPGSAERQGAAGKEVGPSAAQHGGQDKSPRPEAAAIDQPLQQWMEQILPGLAVLAEEEQEKALRQLWAELEAEEVLVMVKLLSGTFRIGVGQGLVLRALATLSGVEEAELQHRLMGGWEPSAARFTALLEPLAGGQRPTSQPYPFFLASPLPAERLSGSDPAEWLVEWKWDGIRGQLIRRGGAGFLWSRGEDLLNESFPDLLALADQLPEGCALDGEVLVWPAEMDRPEPFAVLQRRLGRRLPAAALLRELPASFVAYDLLESDGVDRRREPLQQRRARLSQLLNGQRSDHLRLSTALPLSAWSQLDDWRDRARDAGAEGLMLKHRASAYGAGRRRGSWWKHKLEPMHLDAVLLYARTGSGRRANLYTDYTFGLWADAAAAVSEARVPRGAQGADDEAAAGADRRLVSFASAYSGLTDAEILELDRWIRRHTTERFGPVRAVVPELVFELAFEGVQRSRRHRSGVAVRFPRISRWRHDKPAAEADTLAAALALIPP